MNLPDMPRRFQELVAICQGTGKFPDGTEKEVCTLLAKYLKQISGKPSDAIVEEHNETVRIQNSMMNYLKEKGLWDDFIDYFVEQDKPAPQPKLTVITNRKKGKDDD